MSALILLLAGGATLADCWVDERDLFLDDPRGTPEIADARAKRTLPESDAPETDDFLPEPPAPETGAPRYFAAARAPRPGPSAWLARKHSRSPT